MYNRIWWWYSIETMKQTVFPQALKEKEQIESQAMLASTPQSHQTTKIDTKHNIPKARKRKITTCDSGFLHLHCEEIRVNEVQKRKHLRQGDLFWGRSKSIERPHLLLAKRCQKGFEIWMMCDLGWFFLNIFSEQLNNSSPLAGVSPITKIQKGTN